MYGKIMKTPVGPLYIADDGCAVCEVRFVKEADAMDGLAPSALTLRMEEELLAYFRGTLTAFTIPIHWEGTPFQMRVWEALLSIPYGETRSYGEIARQIGNPKAARAVGMANNRNPISIVVPCHRVIGSNRKLIGYGGGLDKKEYLLKMERTAHANG